jgi:IS5 family transposase
LRSDPIEVLHMATDDFFRSRLDQMIDLRHPLVVLAQRMPRPQIEAALAYRDAPQASARR